MMKIAGLIVVVAATVYCESDSCCFPERFQSRVHTFVEWATLSASAYFDVYFDTKNQRVRLDFDNTDNLDELYLYKENVVYSFNKTYCEKHAIPHPPPIHCIPENAKKSPSYRLGGQPGIILVDYAWSPAEGVFVDVGITDHCAPVTSVMVAPNETVVVIEEFQNFQPRAAESHFVVPPQCKHNVKELNDVLFGGLPFARNEILNKLKR